MSKNHTIIALESLTCLTFSVLSAEAPLYAPLMASRLHPGCRSERPPPKLRAASGSEMFVERTLMRGADKSRCKPFIRASTFKIITGFQPLVGRHIKTD